MRRNSLPLALLFGLAMTGLWCLLPEAIGLPTSWLMTSPYGAKFLASMSWTWWRSRRQPAGRESADLPPSVVAVLVLDPRQDVLSRRSVALSLLEMSDQCGSQPIRISAGELRLTTRASQSKVSHDTSLSCGSRVWICRYSSNLALAAITL